MNLYIVHDEEYNHKIVVKAPNAEEAIKKLRNYLKETKQIGILWSECVWMADLCDNDKVLE